MRSQTEILTDGMNALIEKIGVFEAEVFYGGDANLEKDVGELLANLKEEYLKEILLRKMQELYNLEEKKDTEKISQILKEINEINSKIQGIKNSR